MRWDWELAVSGGCGLIAGALVFPISWPVGILVFVVITVIMSVLLDVLEPLDRDDW